MPPNANQEDHQWCDNDKKKKEEDDNGKRTLECLRGRLLAERQTSKIAKEEAQFLGNKIMELETKLKQETKLRHKADKKLKSLIKKLQSLNISPTSPALDFYFSDSSEITDISSTSLSSADKDSPVQSSSKSLVQHQDSRSDSSISESPSVEEMEKVDNSLALVPLDLSIGTKNSELSTVNKNVSEVLEALKNAREKIEMERRRNNCRIKAG